MVPIIGSTNLIDNYETKEEIVANWLPVTQNVPGGFGEYILLTNFNKYVEIFANQI